MTNTQTNPADRYPTRIEVQNRIATFTIEANATDAANRLFASEFARVYRAEELNVFVVGTYKQVRRLARTYPNLTLSQC